MNKANISFNCVWINKLGLPSNTVIHFFQQVSIHSTVWKVWVYYNDCSKMIYIVYPWRTLKIKKTRMNDFVWRFLYLPVGSCPYATVTFDTRKVHEGIMKLTGLKARWWLLKNTWNSCKTHFSITICTLVSFSDLDIQSPL